MTRLFFIAFGVFAVALATVRPGATLLAGAALCLLFRGPALVRAVVDPVRNRRAARRRLDRTRVRLAVTGLRLDHLERRLARLRPNHPGDIR